jgi:hypothetical protein
MVGKLRFPARVPPAGGGPILDGRAPRQATEISEQLIALASGFILMALWGL